ncbi:MAG: dTDP-4-dehydrorhamnose 3,5-epimerase [Acidobacteriota bacterium]
MKFIPTDLPGVLLIEPTVFEDPRGFFFEVHHAGKFAEAGIEAAFVQDNHSASQRNTLRGLHAQRTRPQGKMVRVLAGTIFDVAVDIQPDSEHFGRWVGYELSAENRRQLYIPEGFAHGFAVTSERAEVEYKCTALYDPSDEIAIAWNDADIGIDWPVSEPTLSPRDAGAPTLAEIKPNLVSV